MEIHLKDLDFGSSTQGIATEIIESDSHGTLAEPADIVAMISNEPGHGGRNTALKVKLYSLLQDTGAFEHDANGPSCPGCEDGFSKCHWQADLEMQR